MWIPHFEEYMQAMEGSRFALRASREASTLLQAQMVLYSRGTKTSKEASALYRGTSLATKRNPLGTYRRPMPRILVRSKGGGHFLMGEVLLFTCVITLDSQLMSPGQLKGFL